MKKRNAKLLSTCLCLLLAALMCITMLAACGGEKNPDTGKEPDVPDTPDTPDVPDGPGEEQPQKPDTVAPLDLYVSLSGNDATADGSAAKTFATLAAARDYVRKLDKTWYSSITVHVGAGEYMNTYFNLSVEDAGTETCPITYIGDGEQASILNAGISLKLSDFKPVTDEATLARLCDDAKANVVCVKLSDYGVTAEQYGGIYARGVYCTAVFYDDGQYTGGSACELFYNGRRMTLARYPNEGWLGTGEVVQAGDNVHENGGRFTAGGNPNTDTYRIDADLAARIASWATFKDVWMYGYWYYDWADSASLIGAFDKDQRLLTNKFSSWYGARADAPYYFYNVFEELDAPGEWYLDRENGVLYLYPNEDADLNNDTIDMSLYAGAVVACSASNVTIDNLTVKNSRGNGFWVSGNNITVQNCHVTCVAGCGMQGSGVTNSLFYNNVINYVGSGGIWVNGGDGNTLTRGNNLVDNNLIHNWSEVIMVSQDGISLTGCGNTASHNELHDSPHTGMSFSGPYQVLEYNELYRVCENATDSGAIYAGRNWVSYGSEVRYNYLHDIGNDDFQPIGIYMDDCMSGVRIFGNLLVDISGVDDWVHGQAFQIGGGRDMVIENNIIVNTMAYDAGSKWYSFMYDQRGYDGLMDVPDYTWFTHTKQGGGLFAQRYNEALQKDLWNEAFPNWAQVQDDYSNVEGNPYFGGNPGCSVVKNNVIISACTDKHEIKPLVSQYGEVEDFIYVNDVAKVFRKWTEGDWTMYKKASVITENGLEWLDVAQMGRQN